MSIAHRILTATRDACASCARALSRRLQPDPFPDELQIAPEELERLGREMQRRGQRASRVPWYHSRPGELRIPESLRYLEDTKGSKYVLGLLREKARKLENEGL